MSTPLGYGWYRPSAGKTWSYNAWYEWVDPEVYFFCLRYGLADLYVEQVYPVLPPRVEGYALLLPYFNPGEETGNDPWEEPDLDLHGPYGGGGSGNDEQECYEVWYVWDFGDGIIYSEYAGFDVCFDESENQS